MLKSTLFYLEVFWVRFRSLGPAIVRQPSGSRATVCAANRATVPGDYPFQVFLFHFNAGDYAFASLFISYAKTRRANYSGRVK